MRSPRAFGLQEIAAGSFQNGRNGAEKIRVKFGLAKGGMPHNACAHAVISQASTTRNMRWIIRDKRTGLENHDILWKFETGDKVMIRIRNDSADAHPMPTPSTSMANGSWWST
jgi:hypothetical protein